jgi:hypothetical protein
LLDHPCGEDADLDIGALGRPAQQVERLVRSAPVLGHQDALGLLDHRHAVQPGQQPGKRGIVQDLWPGSIFLDCLNGRFQARSGLFKPLGLGVELPPRGVQPGRVVLCGVIRAWVHEATLPSFRAITPCLQPGAGWTGAVAGSKVG